MYKKTFLLTKPAMTELLVSNTKNLIDAITNAMLTEDTVNIFLLLHHYATDVICEFTYGPNGATYSLLDPKYRHVAEQFALSDRRAYQLCQIYLPFLTSLYTRLVEMVSTDKRIGVMDYGWQAVQSAKTEKLQDPEESLVSLMMVRNEFSDAYIASELVDHFVIPTRYR